MAITMYQTSWVCTLNSCKSKAAIYPRTSSYKVYCSIDQSDGGSSPLSNSSEVGQPNSERMKLALDRAKEYKKSLKSGEVRDVRGESIGKLSDKNNGEDISADTKKESIYQAPTTAESESKNGAAESLLKVGDVTANEVPEPIRVSMEKAKEYQKNKVSVPSSEISRNDEILSGAKAGNMGGARQVQSKDKEKAVLKMSSIDFMGLEFSENKDSRRLPAGLVPVLDPFSVEDLPEVELLVGDAKNFRDASSLEPNTTLEENSDVYKPKVSTWGMFPRPSNISKTFGGGRTIRPGEALETEEDKAAKQARTRQLLAAYKSKMGLNIDPKLKAECEKALRDGDSLMDAGKLKEALPYYQKVMEKMVFLSELHGLAALQWSICQDSISRQEEARVMYEKLQSHPNAQVSKRARQFVFSFQAMEMMRINRSKRSTRNTGYQNFFDAFVKDKADVSLTSSYAEEGTIGQAVPYIVFLLSPILMVLLFAMKKRM